MDLRKGILPLWFIILASMGCEDLDMPPEMPAFSWRAVNSGTSLDINTVVFGKGIFVALGGTNSGFIDAYAAYSEDGLCLETRIG